jgi:hypothetical protein
MPRRPQFAAEFEIAHHTTGKVHSIKIRARQRARAGGKHFVEPVATSRRPREFEALTSAPAA